MCTKSFWLCTKKNTLCAHVHIWFFSDFIHCKAVNRNYLKNNWDVNYIWLPCCTLNTEKERRLGISFIGKIIWVKNCGDLQIYQITAVFFIFFFRNFWSFTKCRTPSFFLNHLWKICNDLQDCRFKEILCETIFKEIQSLRS